MNKIKTIFDRDWEGNRKVINKYIDEDFENSIKEIGCVATEKLDGTNVRLTVRQGTLVRLEKRWNPTKLQKAKGILEPWYKDADEYAPEDKYIWKAARNKVKELPDGEWSGEAIGPKIQGNPLNLEEHTVFVFSLESEREKVIFNDVPTDFEGLKEWLPKQKSKFGNDCGIEGIVWHCLDRKMYKIKKKDFWYD